APSRAAVRRRTESKDAAPSSPGKRDPHVIPERRPPPHTAAGSFAKGSGVAVRVCAQRESLIRRWAHPNGPPAPAHPEVSKDRAEPLPFAPASVNPFLSVDSQSVPPPVTSPQNLQRRLNHDALRLRRAERDPRLVPALVVRGRRNHIPDVVVRVARNQEVFHTTSISDHIRRLDKELARQREQRQPLAEGERLDLSPLRRLLRLAPRPRRRPALVL